MKRLLCLSALIPLLLFAETYNLNQIQDIAIKNNYTLKSKEIQANSKEFQVKSKKSNNYPRLLLKGNASYCSEVSEIKILTFKKEIGTNEKYDLNLQIQQPIWTGNRISSEIDYANKDLLSSNSEIKILKDQIYYQTAVLYYNLLLTDKYTLIINESINRLDNQLNRIKNLYKSKQAIAQDTLDIANKRLELLTQKIEIDYQKPIIMAQLKQLMNIDYDFEIDHDVVMTTYFNDLAVYQNQALANREEFKKIKLEIEKLELQSTIVHSALLPQVFAQAEYHYANPGVQMESQWDDYYTAGIGFSVNLFDWNETSDKNMLIKNSVKQMLNEKSQLELNIKADVEQLYWQIKSNQQQYITCLKLVEQETQRYQLTKTKYENAQITALDLLDVETKVREANHKLEQIMINLKLNEAKMNYLRGNIGR